MKNVKVKIEGLQYIDCVGTIQAEDFMRDVCAGDYGEADIVDFHVTRDPDTLAYQEQNILIHMMRHLYNAYQTHAIFCRDCDTWKFGRGDHVFKSPCEDHDTITMAINCSYDSGEILVKLRQLKDAFARHTEGEHQIHLYIADTYFSTAEHAAVLELQYPSSEEEVHQMVDTLRELCPELTFTAREPVNCYVEVKSK